MKNKYIKRLGLCFLLLPFGFILFFAFGEVFSGDISGLGHLIQILPLTLLVFLALKRPLVGGLLLVLAGLVFGIWYLVVGKSDLQAALLIEGFLFVPVIASGTLLILSSKFY